MIKIDQAKCNGCKTCISVCPVAALKYTDKLEIDEEKCLDCGLCVGVCKQNALSY